MPFVRFPSQPFPARVALQGLAFLLVVVGLSVPSQAWQAAPAAKIAKEPAAKTDGKKDELPEPVEEKIVVREAIAKLTMSCTYYPSNLGKDAIPVILLHGFEGSRSDYDHLASSLHKLGHAVIVPDLRGHGASNYLHMDDGRKVELVPKKITDFNLLVSDVDAIKSWLLEKNNAGELNLEMLVVVGADMSSITAMNWALRDWNAPLLLNYKNAQDVKAVVLLSPDQTFRNTNLKAALKHPYIGGKMSTMIIVGSKATGPLDEAKRLHSTLQRQHGENNTEKKLPDREVWYLPVETNLQGTKLLDRNLKVDGAIAKFIQLRIQDKIEDFDYSQRIRP